ncbi:MAG: hypothetical protein ABI310_04485 [Microbacteriaceae bacterium]
MRKAIAVAAVVACVAFAALVIGVSTNAFSAFGASGAFGTSGAATAISCPAAAPVTVGQITVPAGPVAGYCQDRLINAAQIMSAARAQGIGTHTQAVGVMTAMGESGLRVLDYGDAAGPDSRGLFQQRDNGAWGTLADRMDPYTSATNFFNKLTSLDGWKTMSPTEAAHAVQVNDDPNHYVPFWAGAQRIVAALSPSGG